MLLKKLLKHVHECNINSNKDMRHPVPLVLGRQGVGKSAIIKETGKDLEEKFGEEGDDRSFGWIKLQGSMLEHPADILGYPETNEEGETEHLPHEWFFEMKKHDEGILFIDEFLRTAPPAQNALYDLILWGELGQRNIPDDWTIVCASNPPTNEYYVEDMDPALIDRFLVFPFKAKRQHFMNWAKSDGNISDEVVGYYQQNKELVTLAEPEIPFEIEPTHRSLEMLDLLYKNNLDEDLLHAIIAGTIGEENFQSFRDYVEMTNSGVNPEEVVKEYSKVQNKIKSMIGDDGTVEMQVLKPITENVVDYLVNLEEDVDDIEELNPYRKNIKRFLLDIPTELLSKTFNEICEKVDPKLVQDEEIYNKIHGEEEANA